ncbi:Phosphate ABC transporter, periplasmic phosphate-binding protein PstS [Acidisarcina polymorpha]|uniref:Phosphate-binding protein n=1 Tax=Acidisarcina polymorpha TaxID=2211140 RepID=A0A2Z5G7M1_9BACT|nr:phosphate ABC transporter substrate-binding protein PstS [Acidisarcina polymorpha]AXC14665.1 Phosphate ABC transporter, periplasmic phosphate-binding protein PstS [Acidisarcina polymorpha]
MKLATRASASVKVSLAGAALALCLSSCNSGGGSGSENVSLNGAGSSFVYPVMQRWIQDYSKTHSNTQINYQSIGSGGGIQQVKAGTVDFGASDAPLDDTALAGMKPVIQIPESAGPVVVTYNLPDLKQPLQLSGTTLTDIFLKKVKTWHDPAIAKDNPGVTLPNTKIVVVHRADSSGTTNAFTTYLAAVSPEWKTKIGAGTQVQWPGDLGGKGSEGVTGQVRQTPGAIGYVELTFATQNKLPIASIGNQANKYIVPSAESTTAAIAAFADQLTKDPRIPIVNPPASAADAYPISTLTFLIIPKDGTDAGKRSALKSFIHYVITDGQTVAGTLSYAPLPDAVKQYNDQSLNQMTTNSQPIQ